MASIATLSAEEIKQAKAKGTDPELIKAYVPSLEAAAVGAWLKVNLDEGEEVRTVKRRMSMAARTVGKSILWKRDRGDGAIVGEVKTLAGNGPAAAPPATPEPKKELAQTRA